MGNFSSRIIRNPEHSENCGSPSTVDNAIDNATTPVTPTPLLTIRRNDFPAVVDNTVNISPETVAYPDTVFSNTVPLTPALNIETNNVPDEVAYNDTNISSVTVTNPVTPCKRRKRRNASRQGSNCTSPTPALNIETDDAPDKVAYNNDKGCEIGGTTDGNSNNQGNSSCSRWYWLLAEDGSHATIHTTTTKTPASVRKKRNRQKRTTSSCDAEAEDEQELFASGPRRKKKNVGERRMEPRMRTRSKGTESCKAKNIQDLFASRPRSRKKITDERKTKTRKRKRPKGTTASCEVVEDDQELSASRYRCPKKATDKRRITLPRARNVSKRIKCVVRKEKAFSERRCTAQTTTRWFWHLAEDGSPANIYNSTEPKESTVSPPAKRRRRPPKKKYSRPAEDSSPAIIYNSTEPKENTRRFDALWEEKFALLQKYKLKHKTTRVHHRHMLGMWLAKQRSAKKCGKLLPDRLARLEYIGIEWEFRKRIDWNVMCDFLGAHTGKQQSPTSIDPPTKSRLRAWAKWQQQRFQIGKLSEEQMARLDSIGFDYTQLQTSQGDWMHMYHRLVAYKKKNGTTRVPYTWNSDTQLGEWVSNQRRYDRCKQKDRVLLMNQIGFDWFPRDR